MHITLNNFKLRHICVFSINKNMKSEKYCFRYDGLGKSTIGKLISKRLKLEFLIDNCIEKKSGMKITKYLMILVKNFRELRKKSRYKF